MVKHIIVWKLKEEFSAEKKDQIKADIKFGLESLAGKIPGMESIHVYTEGLKSSNGDLMLEATYKDEASLNGYTVHPEHQAVAKNTVRPFVDVRMCFDYAI